MASLDLTEHEKEILKRAKREEIHGYLGGEPFSWMGGHFCDD
jgi:hypothetical protein